MLTFTTLAPQSYTAIKHSLLLDVETEAGGFNVARRMET